MRPLRLALVLAGLLAASLFEPRCFRFFVRQFIQCEAWRAGVNVQIAGVEGSLFEPLTLRDSVWIYEVEQGTVTRVEIQTATAVFSWRDLFPRTSTKWFQRLTVEGVVGKIQLPRAGQMERTWWQRVPRPGGRWVPTPERIEARGVDFIFQSNDDYLRLAQTDFTLSKVEAGTIRAGQIFLKQPWLTRTFRDVRGTTKIEEARLDIANLRLEPGVEVRDLSAQLDALARGQLNLDFDLAAFGGNIRAEAATLPDAPVFAIDVTATFSQIAVAKLAMFLGLSEAAGGTISSGKLTFRGPPQQFARAAGSLRFEASNFQWESRQWDSLVLGMTLMDGRMQIPELALTQGHNHLNLNGDMALPVAGVAWWQSEFTFNIGATIENLTELSALMLPEFRFAAGRGKIDGSIRGKNQQFNGQLLVSGADLRWRNAPIEELHAGVKIEGNEFRITNVSLFNDGDYVRGGGVVNILGDKQYWGELRASIVDLAKYSALLQKPIVPEPLAGGAVIDWNGEGSAHGHSGKFSARLNKVRSLGATAALLHPINADLDGSYAPGSLLFSRFALADDTCSFVANVAVGNKALSLQGVRLMHAQTVWLEGDALLPFDVWNAWPSTSLATLLTDETVGWVRLTAANLQLREAAQLTGWKFPIDGIVNGKLDAEGPAGALQTSGKITLSKGVLPLGWNGETLSGVEGEVVFAGQTVRSEKITATHATGAFHGSGEIDFTNLRDPALKLAVNSARATLHPFPAFAGGLEISTALALTVTGPLSAAEVGGTAEISGGVLPDGLDLRPLLEGDEGVLLPPVFEWKARPWAAWNFAIEARATAAGLSSADRDGPVSVRGGMALIPEALAVACWLTGRGASPALAGQAGLQNFPAHAGAVPLWIDSALLTFRDGFPQEPSLELAARGAVISPLPDETTFNSAPGQPFALHLTGTVQHPIRDFTFAPPLTERIVRAELAGEHQRALQNGGQRFSLLVPAAFREGVELEEWAVIEGAVEVPVPVQ